MRRMGLVSLMDRRTRIDLTRNQFPITALREIKLLKLLSHKNVLRLEDMAVEHPARSSMLPFLTQIESAR